MCFFYLKKSFTTVDIQMLDLYGPFLFVWQIFDDGDDVIRDGDGQKHRPF